MDVFSFIYGGFDILVEIGRWKFKFVQIGFGVRNFSWVFIFREIIGQVGIDRVYESAERGEKRFEGRIVGYYMFRVWEKVEELVGGQKRNFRDGGGEVGRCSFMEIKKGECFKEEGWSCC